MNKLSKRLTVLSDLVDGKIVKTGNADLAKTIEENGYEEYKRKED